MTPITTTECFDDSILPIEDKQYCDQLLRKYRQYQAHIDDLLKWMRTKNETIADSLKEQEPVSFCPLSDLIQPVASLEDLKQQTASSFLYQVETYFHKKYSLHFDSLNEQKGELPLFENYVPILQNLIRQVGADFTKAGTEQIKERFCNLCSPSRIPERKGNKICLPSIAIYESFGNGLNRNYSCRVLHLLKAVALLCLNTLEIPESFLETYYDLQRRVDFSKSYSLCPAASLHFYKNQRVDIVFANEASALKFWYFFELKKIGLSNNETAKNVSL